MLVDKENLMSHFDNDKELIKELIELFEESYPEHLNGLLAGIESNNHKDVHLHAHTLKGMIANFFAKELKEIAFSIEGTAKEEKSLDLNDKVKGLENGIPLMIKEIKELV